MEKSLIFTLDVVIYIELNWADTLLQYYSIAIEGCVSARSISWVLY